ncbi:Hypothetical protein CINCED_3A019056 [Cinara cedri]|uniref:Uncharacterized protein n=1 Tax=Cinara cedri TaxID=506608 RepID=A0A5E4NLZ8_9HEMI|nr:Hypothetical protein CINCED_3A019056 [Cinara cedri]
MCARCEIIGSKPFKLVENRMWGRLWPRLLRLLVIREAKEKGQDEEQSFHCTILVLPKVDLLHINARDNGKPNQLPLFLYYFPQSFQFESSIEFNTSHDVQ